MSSSFWVPEHPSMALYRAKVPHRTGKLGETEHLCTASIYDAMQFPTREACEAWIAANPHPVFVARDHAIMDEPPASDSMGRCSVCALWLPCFAGRPLFHIVGGERCSGTDADGPI